jgi:hypothetical protein
MIDKMMNWTAPLGRAQPGLGWTPCYGVYMSGQKATGGGEGVNGEGLQYKNSALSSTFH